jgi:nitrogen fixation protein NifB
MNEQAHDKVPRLHLPVASTCNTRCIYCRRGIAAAGLQMGPGRTENILTPAEAVLKTAHFLEEWGEDAIVGIAGPGDPLANPETIETIQLLHEHFKGIRLCLCTNGLALLDHLPLLQQIGLRHLTVTVNGIAPEIVKQIQPWIRYQQKVYTGRVAAEMLIEQQLEGIKQASRGNIFVKINCVVLEGINSSHVLETATEVKRHGARLINLIPRLNTTSDGLFRPATAHGLQFLQQEVADVLPVFTKCKQCRADAEGIPGREGTYV